MPPSRLPAPRPSVPAREPWSEAGFLRRLRGAGAHRVDRVRFRPNRRTLWSVTAGGRRLNLHHGYRMAPAPVVDAFAALLVGLPARRGDTAVRRARERIRSWAAGRREFRTEPRPGPCCATPAQRAFLREEFRRLNGSRFDGLLPEVPVRLSRRMTRRLGHMRGHVREGRREVVEVALSLDLMLPGNDGVRTDTLLHEMAHAADWLVDGGRGHGPGWKAWARRAGCVDRACSRAPLVRRARPGVAVRRVPP